MLLVFAVVLFITLYIVFRDKTRAFNSSCATDEKDRRKTNAYKEYMTFCQYFYDQKLNVEESFEKTQNDILDAGFAPCIPLNAWKGMCNENPLLHRGPADINYLKYEAYYVQERRKRYLRIKANNNEEPDKVSCRYRKYAVETVVPESVLYDNWPTTERAWKNEMYKNRVVITLAKKDDYITVTGWGTCQILQVTDNGIFAVRILSDNRIAAIPHNDKRIRYL